MIWDGSQVWLHDGVLCVPGHSRTRRDARTFRVANVGQVVPADTGTARVPVPADIWGAAARRFGIDEDRPGDDVIRLRCAVARWTHSARWHPSQVDTWIEKGALLAQRRPHDPRGLAPGESEPDECTSPRETSPREAGRRDHALGTRSATTIGVGGTFYRWCS
jgi:hypothetical protein